MGTPGAGNGLRDQGKRKENAEGYDGRCKGNAGSRRREKCEHF